MENKKRFKLYKKGKLWCCAAIAFATLMIGTTTVTTARADVNSNVTIAKSVQGTKSNAPTTVDNSSTDQQVTNQVPVDDTTQNNDVNANNGHLDSYQTHNNVKTGDTTLQVSGWQATGQSNNERYRYAIAYDNTTNRELDRQRVTPQARTDVQQAYPNIANSKYSGFTITFKLPNDLSGHSISVVARYSDDAINGEGQHTDYWFAPIIFDNQNRASLDNLSSDQEGKLHVSGWHGTNKALGKQYHYIIAYDQTQNHEIARQLVNPISRPDVAKAFPTIADAENSGFDVTFKLSPEYAEDNIQFISRWTSDPAGNGDATDYWFGPVQKQNRGNLDQWNLSDGNLVVSGWHANDASIYQPYHYLIVFDNTSGQQIASKKVPTVTSDDVAKAYGDTRSANKSRFNTYFDGLNLIPGHTYSLVSRYSTSNTGNGDDGNGSDHTDYWYPSQTLNQHAYNIDGWSTNGRHLTVNGWFANDESLNKSHPFVILIADGKEIARKEVTLTKRDDVADAYKGMYKSDKSGFIASFDLPDGINNNLQLVLRFSDATDGEGNHADIWTSTYAANAGNFDNIQINGNSLHVSGWHAAINTFTKPYQYIIVTDGATGQELNRWNITNNGQSGNTRFDVQNAYPWIYNSANSGFNLTANGINSGNYAYFRIIHRYTDDSNGNGNYIDYSQVIDNTNYEQRLIDAWRNIINGKPGHIGIAVKSQLTGKTYSYTNAPGYHWETMSTVKVAVLSELLHRTGGNLDGTMQNLATRMIRFSDNNATTAITNNYLGGAQGLRPLYERLGMWNTGTNSTWGSSWTTPEDQIKLLNDLYLDQNSGYLNQQSRDYVHYQMNNVSAGQDWGISAGTPRGSFYIKNGWMPWGYEWVNSIGFIPSADNHHGYAIAVYTDGDASFQSGINVIEQLARATKGILQ